MDGFHPLAPLPFHQRSAVDQSVANDKGRTKIEAGRQRALARTLELLGMNALLGDAVRPSPFDCSCCATAAALSAWIHDDRTLAPWLWMCGGGRTPVRSHAPPHDRGPADRKGLESGLGVVASTASIEARRKQRETGRTSPGRAPVSFILYPHLDEVLSQPFDLR